MRKDTIEVRTFETTVTVEKNGDGWAATAKLKHQPYFGSTVHGSSPGRAVKKVMKRLGDSLARLLGEDA